MDFITSPAMITIGLTMAGVILAKIVFPYLEKLVGKTPSMADDEFLAATEKIVSDAVAKKVAKAKSKISN